jgi:fermentation-respiration switch protein FrsA (DUF1100 family)
VRLRGWLFDPGRAQHSGPRAAVVVCHGYGGDKSPHLNVVRWFLEAGIPLLLFDFRNHAGSDGGLTSIGYYERYDVLGAVDWLVAHGYGKIGLYGFSMGAATALATAPLSPHITCIVSDSAFAHLRSVLAAVVRMRLRGGLITRLMEATIWRMVEFRLRCKLGEADPLRAVRRIGRRPLLLIHGTRDLVIPVGQAQALMSAASGPAELWVVDGAEHTCIDRQHPDEYRAKVIDFFQRNLAT